jgi:hypothetical protein
LRPGFVAFHVYWSEKSSEIGLSRKSIPNMVD